MKKSRRQFVRQFAFGSVTAWVGRPWVGALVASVLSPRQATAASDGAITLRVSDFPALSENLGSIRVGVNPMGGSYPSGDFYPIIVTRSGNQFYAVSSNCTHRGCVVQPFNGVSIVCPCHGSEYTLDGFVTQPPADTNLLPYTVTFDGIDQLKIIVPGLGYSITSYSLINGPVTRVRLEFPTFTQVDYEIRWREKAKDPWQVVPFALTQNGPADSLVLTGDGTSKTVFPNRPAPAGFFCVSIIVRKI